MKYVTPPIVVPIFLLLIIAFYGLYRHSAGGVGGLDVDASTVLVQLPIDAGPAAAKPQ